MISTMCILIFTANVLVFKEIYVTHLEEGGRGSYGWRRGGEGPCLRCVEGAW